MARLHANRAEHLALRGQIDRALAAEEGTAVEGRYRETNEAEYDLWVMRATSRKQMGEAREPERPDRSMFAERARCSISGPGPWSATGTVKPRLTLPRARMSKASGAFVYRCERR